MAASSPTNFPLLRLRDVERHQLFALPFEDFSRTHLQARAPNLRPGHYVLSITVNGLTAGGVVRVGDAPPTPAPDTFIGSKPPASTSETSAFFSFAANMGGVTFECSLDGVGFTPCDASITYVDLAQGAHFIQVRARSAEGTVDPSPASYAWTITSSPSVDTVITSAPPAFTNQQAATFAFSSDSGSFFTCSLDGAPFTHCGSPVSYARPAEGTHTFRVRAHDSAGNADPTPASHTWTLDLTVPNTALNSSPSTRTNQTSATFTFSSPEAGAIFQCSLDGVSYTACTSPALYIDLSPGSHNFRVRALDAAGNVDATPVTFIWTVDLTAPNTTLSSTPESLTRLASAAFTFASSETNSTFQCSLDGEAFTACGSPASYTNLAVGPHSFQVRARDQAGNVDASPATFLWTVDQTAPETSLTASPPALTSQAAATFTFASEPGATFQCSLDGATFSPCTSPFTATLAEGPHVFQVRASDAAGNVDATPASASWTLDLTAPETSLTSAPGSLVHATSATFAFSSEVGATFECRLDDAAFTPCASPHAFAWLTEGPHVFQVRARDAAGNLEATPASHSWSIDVTAPATSLTSAPASLGNATSALFTFVSSEEAASFDCALDGQDFTACGSPLLLAGLTEGPHFFQVRARDVAGNVDASPAVFLWSIDLTAPETGFTSAPPALTQQTSATFTFSSEAGAALECGLNGAAFSACTSPVSFTGLSEGPYTFRVRARDAAGNVDATPATHSWSIDLTTPETGLTSAPAPFSNPPDALFAFTSNKAHATFECSLDGAPFTACASPVVFSRLSEVRHTFQVRARSPLTGADATPATHSWTPDYKVPETLLLSAPSTPSPFTSATFRFSSNEPAATFECSLDGARFAPCVPPYSVTGLAERQHTFQVRARDAAGNVDGSPVAYSWWVQLTAAPPTP
jgi:hypothetical protein